MVINANIFMKDVFVPDDMRLEKATDFQKGTNKILESSRLAVSWGAAGTACGAYEAALKYCLERKQFGRPIAKFQLIQEKLSRMLAMCELMLSNLYLATHKMDKGITSMGYIGRVKLGTTSLAREVCSLAREVCGGNGIILDNHVMKQFLDIEATHSYEGTYEVNSLISGRELTGGMSAFK